MAIEDLDENLEPNSSNGTETLDATITDAPEGAAVVTDANSSNATDEDEGLLGVVRDVVKDRAQPDATASSAEGAEGGVDADGKPLPTGQDNETFSDVPFNKHPRFQALIAQRNSFREGAVRYNNVTKFIEENGLSSDEAANALTTFARAKIDPAGAFAELKPWLQDLLVRAGEVLPDDLRGRVEKGELTQETAMELSRERAKSQSHETRQGFEAQRRERQAATQRVTELTSTAEAWEKDRLAKDPNFAAKAPLLMREVAFLQLQEGKPTTAAGVREQLKKAYDAVNKSFKPAATPANPQANRRPAIKPVMGGQVSGTVREKPKTTLDIIRANRRSG